MDDPALPHPSQAPAPYRVLARKYRPAHFDELIGHEAMVRTLANAFESGRIAQAWMLTGVRGVGKTTTARILARALNYSLPGVVDRPTVRLEAEGLHCRAIMEGRHVDVIEMDAASHTSIDDVREIIEAARYKPASARYKVYIIDEVHMLSDKAFNALLKTLEEPPEHVKFVFATTEIRKVPVTILSRCQRFDLRRVDASLIVQNLTRIAKVENVLVDEAALALIARAAEGSVRDSLTLLDQAIAHGAQKVTVETVQAMLGLADRGQIIDLFERLMQADIGGALTLFAELYAKGAEPALILTDLAALVHLVTRLKHLPAAANDPTLTPLESERGAAFAKTLSIPLLARAWQMLLKGLAEVQAAPHPFAAGEMVLVRLAYTSELPTPDEALRLLRGAPASLKPPQETRPSSPLSPPPRALHALQASAASAPQQDPLAAPRMHLARFEDAIRLAEEKRDIALKHALERTVRLVRFEDGHIAFTPTADARDDLAQEISRKFTAWTGQRWMATVSRDGTAKTLHEERETIQSRLISDARADPAVAAVLKHFPGSEIVNVRILTPQDPSSGFPSGTDDSLEGEGAEDFGWQEDERGNE